MVLPIVLGTDRVGAVRRVEGVRARLQFGLFERLSMTDNLWDENTKE